VPDTDEALQVWRDQVGLDVLYSEEVNGGAVGSRISILATPSFSSSNARCRPSVESLAGENGPGLHHFCFKVDDVAQVHAELPQRGLLVAPRIYQGTQGKRAFFIDRRRPKTCRSR